MSTPEIRWHLVSDLDLPVLIRSEDPELAAAAAAEDKRRRALGGGMAEFIESLLDRARRD